MFEGTILVLPDNIRIQHVSTFQVRSQGQSARVSLVLQALTVSAMAESVALALNLCLFLGPKDMLTLESYAALSADYIGMCLQE